MMLRNSILEAVLRKIQKVDVKQRSMDAVVTGLVWGSVASLIVVVGGAGALLTNVWEKYSTPYVLFVWLTLLTALTIGQLYLTVFVSSALAEAPKQTEKAVVQ